MVNAEIKSVTCTVGTVLFEVMSTTSRLWVTATCQTTTCCPELQLEMATLLLWGSSRETERMLSGIRLQGLGRGGDYVCADCGYATGVQMTVRICQHDHSSSSIILIHDHISTKYR